MVMTATQLKPVLHVIPASERGSCFYCGEPGCTRDHVKPRSSGGSNNTDNIVNACARCNSLKGSHRLPSEGLILRLLSGRPGVGREAVAAVGLEPLMELHQAIPGMPEEAEDAIVLALVRAGGALPLGELLKSVRGAMPMNDAALSLYLRALRRHVTVRGEQVALASLEAVPEGERAATAALLELLFTWKARKVRWPKVVARVVGRLKRLRVSDPQAVAERLLAVLVEADVLTLLPEGAHKERRYYAVRTRPPAALLRLAPVLARQLRGGEQAGDVRVPILTAAGYT